VCVLVLGSWEDLDDRRLLLFGWLAHTCILYRDNLKHYFFPQNTKSTVYLSVYHRAGQKTTQPKRKTTTPTSKLGRPHSRCQTITQNHNQIKSSHLEQTTTNKGATRLSAY
jgi:hypothetical protein